MIILGIAVGLVIVGAVLTKTHQGGVCPICGELYPGRNHAMRHLLIISRHTQTPCPKSTLETMEFSGKPLWNHSRWYLPVFFALAVATYTARAQDVGIRWDGLGAQETVPAGLRQTVERKYFAVLDKEHLARPSLLIVHLHTPGMKEYYTRISIGTAQDDVFLAGTEQSQLERELAVMVFLRKQTASAKLSKGEKEE